MSAFQVRPELDPLEREKREIERRRARLEDRRLRILHAKTRIMGVDVDSLSNQVKERQERERLEMERDMYYDSLTNHHAKVLVGLEEERKGVERQRREELKYYRQQQAAEKAQKEAVERSHWTTANDMSSTFLKFAGQDEDKDKRVKAQQQQQADWITRQLHIQAEKEAKERQDEADYAAYQREILALQKQAELERNNNVKYKMMSLAEFNKMKSAEKQERELRDKHLNEHLDQTELSHTLSSALLNETVPTSSLGPNRAIPYHFKGFSTDQRQRILDEQYRQQQEARERRERELQEEKDYADQQEQNRRDLIRLQREKAALEAQKLQQLKDERLAQKKQKDLRDQYFNHVVYTNPVGEEFFQQFGTSCR